MTSWWFQSYLSYLKGSRVRDWSKYITQKVMIHFSFNIKRNNDRLIKISKASYKFFSSMRVVRIYKKEKNMKWRVHNIFTNHSKFDPVTFNRPVLRIMFTIFGLLPPPKIAQWHDFWEPFCGYRLLGNSLQAKSCD